MIEQFKVGDRVRRIPHHAAQMPQGSAAGTIVRAEHLPANGYRLWVHFDGEDQPAAAGEWSNVFELAT